MTVTPSPAVTPSPTAAATTCPTSIVPAPAGPRGFSLTGSMMAMRWLHTATLLPDCRVLVAGGTNRDGDLASAELYDSKTGRFSSTGSMATTRRVAEAVLLQDGRVLIVGGMGSIDDQNGLASAELYDPENGTFGPTGSMTTARGVLNTATLLQDGRVLVTGGMGGSALASSELYDPKTGTFAPTGSMTTPRWSHSAVLLQDGRVLIGGGFPDPISDVAELYDPMTGTFRAAANLPQDADEDCWGAVALLQDGQVLIPACHALFDPKTNDFSSTGAMETPGRSNYTATLLLDGRVLVVGGSVTKSGFADYQIDAELYDPKAGAFTNGGAMSVARPSSTATLLSDGRVLVAGGVLSASAELYQP